MIPKFSIIVPCYNLSTWIGDCLDSVYRQSFTSWECIVVDDESRDNSPVICDEYAMKDSRFTIIHQKNAGEGGARNAGLSIASGEWVFFLDGDDIMAPNALMTLQNIIERFPNENLIRFGFEDFNDGAEIPCGKHTHNKCESIDISTRITYDDYYVYVWQFAFRRTLIADLKFKSYRRGADRAFIIPVLCYKTKSFTATNDVCYFYRTRLGSAVNSQASVQAMKDELSHRLDVVADFDKCGKDIIYANTLWLEEFCVWQYIALTNNNAVYSADERNALLKWYQLELQRMSKAKGFSKLGAAAISFYQHHRNAFAWHLLCAAMRKWYYIRNVLKTNPLELVRRICNRT